MKPWLPLILLTTSVTLAAKLPDYSGVWNIQALADDGGTAEQAVTLTQTIRNNQVYLTGYGLSGPLRSGVGSIYTVSKDSDATRTFSAVLRFSANSMTGSGLLREVYKTGEKVVTRYKLTGARKQ